MHGLAQFEQCPFTEAVYQRGLERQPTGFSCGEWLDELVHIGSGRDVHVQLNGGWTFALLMKEEGNTSANCPGVGFRTDLIKDCIDTVPQIVSIDLRSIFRDIANQTKM